jgi:hypothetical protein
MKAFIFIFSFVFLLSCQANKAVMNSIKPKKQLVSDVNYISEQDALGAWLLNQPQQVRDDFKRDFTFSGKQLKQFVDTIKSKVQKNVN